MFDHDRSASKGNMITRSLIVFKHVGDTPEKSKLGMAHAHRLLDIDTDLLPNEKAIVSILLAKGVTQPRSYEQYRIEVRVDKKPEGIEIIEPMEVSDEDKKQHTTRVKRSLGMEGQGIQKIIR
jgi:CRISPR-associated protein Csd2